MDTHIIAYVPSKMHSVTSLCHSHWPWDITFPRPGTRHKARVSLWLLNGLFRWTGEFSARGCFIQPLYATSASQVSCKGREGVLKRYRACTFLTLWYLKKTMSRYLGLISYKSFIQKYSVSLLFNYIFCAADAKSKMYSPNVAEVLFWIKGLALVSQQSDSKFKNIQPLWMYWVIFCNNFLGSSPSWDRQMKLSLVSCV